MPADRFCRAKRGAISPDECRERRIQFCEDGSPMLCQRECEWRKRTQATSAGEFEVGARFLAIAEVGKDEPLPALRTCPGCAKEAESGALPRSEVVTLSRGARLCRRHEQWRRSSLKGHLYPLESNFVRGRKKRMGAAVFVGMEE